MDTGNSRADQCSPLQNTGNSRADQCSPLQNTGNSRADQLLRERAQYRRDHPDLFTPGGTRRRPALPSRPPEYHSTAAQGQRDTVSPSADSAPPPLPSSPPAGPALLVINTADNTDKATSPNTSDNQYHASGAGTLLDPTQDQDTIGWSGAIDVHDSSLSDAHELNNIDLVVIDGEASDDPLSDGNIGFEDGSQHLDSSDERHTIAQGLWERSHHVVRQHLRETNEPKLAKITRTMMDTMRDDQEISSARLTRARRMSDAANGIRQRKNLGLLDCVAEVVEEDEAPKCRTMIKIHEPDVWWRKYWHVVVSVVIVYNALAQPFLCSFTVQNIVPWLVMDYVGDAFLIVDIVLNFHRASYNLMGIMVVDEGEIRKTYLRRGFWLDFFASLPADVFVWTSQHWHALTRLVRLVRIVRLSQYVYRWEIDTDFPLLVRLGKLGGTVYGLTHFMGCLFYFIVRNDTTPEANGSLWYQSTDLLEHSMPTQYVRSMFWAFTIMTGVGPDHGYPATNSQMAFTCGALIVGLLLFAVIIGHVSDLIADMNTESKRYQERLDSVKQFMRSHDLSKDLQDRVRAYFDLRYRRRKQLGLEYDDDNMLDLFPNHLKKPVSIEIYRDVLRKVPLFANIDDEGFLSMLILSLRTEIYLPGDVIIRKGDIGDEMFFVASGTVGVVVGGKCVAEMSEGQFFGEISVLFAGKRTASIIAHDYVDCLVLDKRTVDTALKCFPEYVDMIYEVAEVRQQFRNAAEARKRKLEEAGSVVRVSTDDVGKTLNENVATAVDNFKFAKKNRTQMTAERQRYIASLPKEDRDRHYAALSIQMWYRRNHTPKALPPTKNAKSPSAEPNRASLQTPPRSGSSKADGVSHARPKEALSPSLYAGAGTTLDHSSPHAERHDRHYDHRRREWHEHHRPQADHRGDYGYDLVSGVDHNRQRDASDEAVAIALASAARYRKAAKEARERVSELERKLDEKKMESDRTTRLAARDATRYFWCTRRLIDTLVQLAEDAPSGKFILNDVKTMMADEGVLKYNTRLENFELKLASNPEIKLHDRVVFK